jgi:hypothetical protein
VVLKIFPGLLLFPEARFRCWRNLKYSIHARKRNVSHLRWLGHDTRCMVGVRAIFELLVFRVSGCDFEFFFNNCASSWRIVLEWCRPSYMSVLGGFLGYASACPNSSSDFSGKWRSSFSNSVRTWSSLHIQYLSNFYVSTCQMSESYCDFFMIHGMRIFSLWTCYLVLVWWL